VKRKRACECGGTIYVCGAKHRGGHGRLADHDLCDRCFRSEYSKVLAARMQPKKWYDVPAPYLIDETGCAARP
jgi:hypothetical protein